jgi:hypothetical protein
LRNKAVAAMAEAAAAGAEGILALHMLVVAEGILALRVSALASAPLGLPAAITL